MPFNSCPLCHGLSLNHSIVIGSDKQKCRLCENCFLISVDPIYFLEPSKEKARYEAHQNDPNNESYRKFIETLIVPLGKHLTPGMRLLDYGAGSGSPVSEILKGSDVTCFEYDPLFSPDISKLEKQYDCVVLSETIEHFKTPHSDLLKVVSLLTRNGILAIMTLFWNQQIDFSTWHYGRDPTHVCFYSKETLKWIEHHFNLRLLFCDDVRVAIFKRN